MKSNSNFNKAFKCANEKEVCSCHGKVIFGKDNRWTDEKEVYGTIACTNMKFKDIFPGVKKNVGVLHQVMILLIFYPYKMEYLKSRKYQTVWFQILYYQIHL